MLWNKYNSMRFKQIFISRFNLLQVLRIYLLQETYIYIYFKILSTFEKLVY